MSARRSGRTDFKSVVIDDFLEPLLAAGLLACLEQDGDFEEHHCLMQPVAKAGSQVHDGGVIVERTVSAKDFAAAPDESRLARELLMRADPSQDTASAGWLAHVRFLDLLASHEFKSYLAAVTDTTDLQDVTYMARTMRHGDLCNAHSDAGDGRALCMLLYVGDGWRSDLGGRFQHVEDGEAARSVEPLGNRLILHRPARTRSIRSSRSAKQAGVGDGTPIQSGSANFPSAISVRLVRLLGRFDQEPAEPLHPLSRRSDPFG